MAAIPHETLGAALKLITILTDGQSHSVKELSEQLEITERNVYYYLKFLKNYGFIVLREGRGNYFLGSMSPFLQELSTSIALSETEALFLYNLANSVSETSPLAEMVMLKLRRFYGESLFAAPEAKSNYLQNAEILRDAIKRKRVVMLKNYSSSHSRTVSDRAVEPFLMMNNGNDVRCYEIASGMNKTFKLARMGKVVILEDLAWSFERRHKQVFTDIFMFSGERMTRVKLRLGQLAYNLMREEYPQSMRLLKQDDETHWIFDGNVVGYVGVGRFVLGLSEDIEVLEDEGLKAYLRTKVNKMAF